MSKYHQKRKRSQKKIAEERIKELFEKADKEFEKDPAVANAFVRQARRISQKFKMPFTKKQKMQFCRKCESFLKPSKNLRVRFSEKIILKCLNCGNIRRISYK